MKRFIGFLLTLLLIFAISQNVTALVLDDVTIDENITFSKNKNEKTDRVTIRFHNYPDDISDNLRLTLNQEEILKPDYTLNRDLITRYYYILIDNSGSMRERDLAAIRKNVSYLIRHIDSHDYVEVITVSDYSSAIYNLAHYSPNVQTRIDSINREGNYSRLYDAVSELNTQVLTKQSADMKKAKHDEQQSLYYILFFSDGEDIESHITGKQMRDGYRDIPFYYFCYASDFKPEKNKPFQEIAGKHGKFFNYLDTEKIDELFFRNENRYTLIFFVNKKEVLKSKSYYIELSKRTTEDGKIIIDLRKYFDGSNLNDMIVDAPKDNTLYHNLRNNLAHDTQFAINNSQFIIHNEGENSVISTELDRSNDNNEQNITSTETKKSNDDNEQVGNNNEQNTSSAKTEKSNGENKQETIHNSQFIIHNEKSNEGNSSITSTETKKSNDENKDDNKTGIAATAAGTAAASALNNKSDKEKSSTPTETTAVEHSQTTVAENNQNDNEMRNQVQHDNTTKNSSADRNFAAVTSTESKKSNNDEILNQVQHDDIAKNSSPNENNADAAKSDNSDNTAAVSDGDDTSNDNAAAVIVPAKAEKQQKQPKQNKTVKEKTEKTKEKSERDNKWLLWLLIILLLLLLLLLLLWLLWWLIRKISDNSRAASNGGGRSSGGIDRTPVETYSPPPAPVTSSSSSSSAAKKPAAKPAANNKVKFRIAKDSYRKPKNRIDNSNNKDIPTFIEEMNKDAGKLKVGSAVTISEIHNDHIAAQSMTSLQPDDIVTINKADFRVIYVRYRSKVYTFILVPLDPNYDIQKNVKITDSVTMAEKTVAVYGSKEAIIDKMLVPSKVEIVSNKWSDGTIDNVTGQSDKTIHSDNPLYLDYVVEIQQGAKTMQYLITEVKYENRKYTGKIRPL